MSERTSLETIADLIGNDPSAGAPAAALLTPDVRSGATFPFSASGNADDGLPPFLVIWSYTVPKADRQTFANAVKDFEQGFGNPPSVVPGLAYRGTYSVSVSATAPDLEYRTIWSLSSLQNLQTLNDLTADTSKAKLQAMLKLIEQQPAMRADIVGRTVFSKILVNQ
jgi:hypothetical protein